MCVHAYAHAHAHVHVHVCVQAHAPVCMCVRASPCARWPCWWVHPRQDPCAPEPCLLPHLIFAAFSACSSASSSVRMRPSANAPVPSHMSRSACKGWDGGRGGGVGWCGAGAAGWVVRVGVKGLGGRGWTLCWAAGSDGDGQHGELRWALQMWWGCDACAELNGQPSLSLTPASPLDGHHRPLESPTLPTQGTTVPP